VRFIANGHDRFVDSLIREGYRGACDEEWWFRDDAEWLPCTDGKARAAEPGTQPLAHGAHSRMGRLRACGNAIVPQVAATFITSALSAIENGVSL
jgi:hypothetical protein